MNNAHYRSLVGDNLITIRDPALFLAKTPGLDNLAVLAGGYQFIITPQDRPLQPSSLSHLNNTTTKYSLLPHHYFLIKCSVI